MIFRCVFVVFVLSCLIAESHAQDSKKPNILFIVIDDLNDWVGCLGGHPQTQTPNIDRLAARGMLFTNAHCQGTMCNPSRISLLWGRRPSSTGFYDNHYPVSKEPDFLGSHVSLPVHFAANGYKTLTAGKVFHGGTVIRKHFQMIGPRLGQWLKGLDQKVHDKPKQWHGIWDFGPQDYDETKFTDHVTATWVAEQLSNKHPSAGSGQAPSAGSTGSPQASSGEPKPFFLSFGFYRPHVPFFPPRRVYDSFEDVQLPRVDEEDWSDLPDAAREVTLSNPKIPTHDWMRKDGRWLAAVHAYLACVRWTDEQLGRVLDALDNGPHARNTIVVLFSDHGYHLGEKQRWSKFSLWERTTHVPLIISVPGGVKGACDKPVELLSIYPTLIDLCGLPANPRLEGVSLRPLLENPNAGWEHVAISTLGQNNHAVRDQRWRYIRYADGSEELYDHQTDPNEWKNLAAEAQAPSHAEVIARLGKHIPNVNMQQRRRNHFQTKTKYGLENPVAEVVRLQTSRKTELSRVRLQVLKPPLTMERNWMTRLVTIALIICCGASSFAEAGKPNVLMICIDDLNDWVGFLKGHPQAITPHMDSLAKRGRVFANAHCAVPVCTSSRVSVMSGLAATTHGSYEFGPKYEQLPALKNQR